MRYRNNDIYKKDSSKKNDKTQKDIRRERKEARHSMEETFVVCGIHPVEEAFDTIPEHILKKAKLYIAETRREKDLEKIYSFCVSLQMEPLACSTQDLNKRVGETRHQGVLLELPEFRYTDLDDILNRLSEQPLLLVLDQIQDPHNLGAIIRSAAAFDADGIIIPRDRAAQINATSIKTSAGQAYRVPICRVSNIAQTLRALKDMDFAVIGADIDGKPVKDIDFHRATVLVMGSEGDGMRRLTRTLCDETVRIEQNPKVESLNVSVATAILLYTASAMRKTSVC